MSGRHTYVVSRGVIIKLPDALDETTLLGSVVLVTPRWNTAETFMRKWINREAEIHMKEQIRKPEADRESFEPFKPAMEYKNARGIVQYRKENGTAWIEIKQHKVRP